MTANKYKDLKGICNKCLGCNQLELIEFEGVSACKNFMKRKKRCSRLY